MDSEYVNDVLVRTDEELGRIIDELDRIVGPDEWVIALTADHGQQPDAEDIDAYGVNPRAVEAAIRQEFGDVVRAVWPTEVFLLEQAMEGQDVTVEEIARFLGGHTLADNLRFSEGEPFTGRFESQNRLFDLAVPAEMLSGFECAGPPAD
jgi:arylsulfatase A-like enzyme